MTVAMASARAQPFQPIFRGDLYVWSIRVFNSISGVSHFVLVFLYHALCPHLYVCCFYLPWNKFPEATKQKHTHTHMYAYSG